MGEENSLMESLGQKVKYLRKIKGAKVGDGKK
jgi:hypothetical protein